MTERMSEPQALPLASVLDLTTIEELYDALRDRSASAAFILDGSAVERITTPCLQLLAAAAKSASQSDMAFKLKNPSPTLIAAIQDLGLANSIPYEA